MSCEPGPCPAFQHDAERLEIEPGSAGKEDNGQLFHRPCEDDFLQFYDRVAPRAMIYLCTFVGPGGITADDAKDIFQDAWICFLQAGGSNRDVIRDPRGYFFRIVRNAVNSHLRAASRQPAPLADPALISDPRALPPDQLAAENEERARDCRQADQDAVWLVRFRRAIDQLQHALGELNSLLRERPGNGTDGSRLVKRGRGAPTKALRFRTITDDTLPKIISWLLKYFQELEKRNVIHHEHRARTFERPGLHHGLGADRKTPRRPGRFG